jgi:zinc/manganese transport system ATP-binding protein
VGPDVLVAVSHVGVRLGGRQVLDDVDFGVEPGEFVGLIGSNGAGKTTLLRVILGLQRPSSGTVMIAGRAPTSRRGAVGYLPQKVALDADVPLRARDVVSLGLDGERLGLPLPSRRKAAIVDELIAAVGAEDFADSRIGRLSGGQQQRILLAHALVSQPRLLLLDEPLANLDPGSAGDVVALLHRLSVERGISIVLSAHDMNPLLTVMSRVVYLAGGRAVAGTIDEVVRSSVLSSLYASPIEVLRLGGRVIVTAGDQDPSGVHSGAQSEDHARDMRETA